MKSLVSRIGPETIRQSRAASKSRYEEGCHLEKGGFGIGAIYFFGYSVEIILVTTYFEMIGFSKIQAIDYPARTRVVKDARRRKLMTSEPHDILGWARTLVADREQIAGSPYPAKFAASLVAKARELCELWSPRMRYHQLDIKPPEVASARAIANWFQQQLNT